MRIDRQEKGIQVSDVPLGSYVVLVAADSATVDGFEYYTVLRDATGNSDLYAGNRGELNPLIVLTQEPWVPRKDYSWVPQEKSFDWQHVPMFVGYDLTGEVSEAIRMSRFKLPRKNFSQDGFVNVEIMEDGSEGGTPVSSILHNSETLFKKEARDLRYLYLKTERDGQQSAYVERVASQDSFPLEILFSEAVGEGTYVADLTAKKVTGGKI